MTAEIDREQIIFTITLVTNYAKGYLETLSDERLIKLYERVMDQEVIQ